MEEDIVSISHLVITGFEGKFFFFGKWNCTFQNVDLRHDLRGAPLWLHNKPRYLALTMLEPGLIIAYMQSACYVCPYCCYGAIAAG